MLFAILTSLLATTALAAPAFNPEILRREVPITRPDSNVTGASDLQIIQLALYYENLEVAFL
jgi:hypothetical protein